MKLAGSRMAAPRKTISIIYNPAVPLTLINSKYIKLTLTNI